MSSILHDDVIIEVLSWLPVESLLRFKVVCKFWHTLITDNPIFSKLHFNHSTQIRNPRVLIHNRKGHQILYSLDYTGNGSRPKEITPPFNSIYDFKILGSCNGLFFIRIINIRKGNDDMLCLWNPHTGESKRLPATPVEFDVNVSSGISIFSRISHTVYGFGYDGIRDDYKVIRWVFFYGQNSEYNSEVKVYRLSKNSWRRIGSSPFKPRRDAPKQSGLLLNGALHWIIKNQQGLIVIFSFDIGSEEYREVPKPHFLDKEGLDDDIITSLNLGVLRGCLCIFHNDSTINCVDVWVMEDYGVKDSWNMLFSIKSDLLAGYNGDWDPSYKPLRFYENGEILMMLNNQDLILYDPEQLKVKYLTKYRYVRHGFNSEAYIESLTSLKSSSCVDQEKAQESTKKKKKNRRKRNRANR